LAPQELKLVQVVAVDLAVALLVHLVVLLDWETMVK
jgi:hypothetical protein